MTRRERARTATRAGAWLLLLMAAGCRADFDAFRFRRDAGATTHSDPSLDPDAHAAADRGDAGAPADAADPPDAAISATDGAASGGAGAPAEGNAGAEAGSGPDAATADDAGDEDAGGDALLAQCSTRLPDPSRASCGSCACASCADPIVACTTRGSEAEQRLCRDVLACALANRCQDYSCYCASAGCGLPGASGDGPCAALIDAAAGGTRSKVIGLRNADPPDLTQPLPRAVRAIGCVLGVHSASPGPTLPGACPAECS